MTKKLLPLQDLLDLANEQIRTRPGFIDGMNISSAEMKGSILFMRGECFLDQSGGATAQTAPAINFYNEFTHEFAGNYSLINDQK